MHRSGPVPLPSPQCPVCHHAADCSCRTALPAPRYGNFDMMLDHTFRFLSPVPHLARAVRLGDSWCPFDAYWCLQSDVINHSRLQGMLGSSGKLAPQCPSWACNGLLAADPATNPDFAAWSKGKGHSDVPPTCHLCRNDFSFTQTCDKTIKKPPRDSSGCLVKTTRTLGPNLSLSRCAISPSLRGRVRAACHAHVALPCSHPLILSSSSFSVFVNYCDGLSFTGDRDEPVPDPTTKSPLYFRGKRNLEAVRAATSSRFLSHCTRRGAVVPTALPIRPLLHSRPCWRFPMSSVLLVPGTSVSIILLDRLRPPKATRKPTRFPVVCGLALPPVTYPIAALPGWCAVAVLLCVGSRCARCQPRPPACEADHHLWELRGWAHGLPSPRPDRGE